FQSCSISNATHSSERFDAGGLDGRGWGRCVRGVGGDGAGRWTTPGESRKWEDWELPCYITSFLTVVILDVGLNAKPDRNLGAPQALERLQ
uniref:Uncharacterized protein n=1 Tax=Aegilops tauschii subsp. strangulata TaxID=200361 RepID=A0A453RJF2_AEGTS